MNRIEPQGHHRVRQKIQVRIFQKQIAGFVKVVTKILEIHKARFWNVRDGKGITVQDVLECLIRNMRY